MKKILIISPHYPPSNLAAVHRTRLFAQHLPNFNWEPIILTVSPDYYEEAPDYLLSQLLPEGQRVEQVTAFGVGKTRLVGDIGLRGFFQLYRKAKELIKTEQIDFVYIPIPSFYAALLGRWLHWSTGIKYGIDYIDPWVHEFPGKNGMFSRAVWASKLARVLEPIAVKRASLITGVAEGYYRGVIDRNPQLTTTCRFAAMPYGGELQDHQKVKEWRVKPYLFVPSPKFKMVYAGALLPKSVGLLDALFQSVAAHGQLFENTEWHFIGTGRPAASSKQTVVKELAMKHGLYGKKVFEYPERIPYLDVLAHLDAAQGIFILGSSESHYSPSKTYQGVLSGKPILAVLHEASTAVGILEETGAGKVITISTTGAEEKILKSLPDFFREYEVFATNFLPQNIKMDRFDAFSAYAVTQILAHQLDSICPTNAQ